MYSQFCVCVTSLSATSTYLSRASGSSFRNIEPLIIRNYCLIYMFKPKDSLLDLYTDSDLRQIQRVFGHPKVRTTVNLVKRTAGGTIPSDVRKEITDLSREFETCRIPESVQNRIKFKLGSQNVRLNHSLQVDTTFMRVSPVRHIVYADTHYTSAWYLSLQ